MGDILKRLCKLLKVHKINTTAYRPESNGPLERAHKTMVEYLRCFSNPQNTNSDKILPFACFVYNMTPHTMTKYTPDEVLFGRTANIPGQLQQPPTPVYNYDVIHDVRKRLQECHEIARANLKQTKQHRVAQQLSKTNMPELCVGHKVLLKNEKASKLDPNWLGPFDVIEVEPKGLNVTIRTTKKKTVKRLKKYPRRE
jgi:hypothetical protein